MTMSRRAKLLVSAWLVLHLAAVALPPLWVLSGDSGPVSAAKRGLSWYIDPMFLNHGYGFFGPDPGPSFLLRCELELPDGRKIEQTYPDLKEHRPRLLYHRHFMLTSRLQFGRASDVTTLYARPYARHLAERYGARHVRLFLVRHELARPWKVAAGMKLDDPSLYAPMPNLMIDGTWTAPLEAAPGPAPPGLRAPEELGPPRAAPSSAGRAGTTSPAVVTLEIVLDRSRQAGEIPRPPGGTASLSNWTGRGELVPLRWEEHENEEDFVFYAADPELPAIVAHRIGMNELLLRLPMEAGERLLIMRRDELPIAEYPENTP
ncbi:MAG: hypothetical protein HYS13_21195 [Planctomycetia bacterium]|nr:hypothetical protein [Planctomycetia bacterium]